MKMERPVCYVYFLCMYVYPLSAHNENIIVHDIIPLNRKLLASKSTLFKKMPLTLENKT